MSRGAQGIVAAVAVIMMIVLVFYVYQAANRDDTNDETPIPTIQEISVPVG